MKSDGYSGPRLREDNSRGALHIVDYFTSFLPVSFSRLPCMMALYFAFDRSRPSKIFSVSRM